jgi:hypothetical protein
VIPLGSQKNLHLTHEAPEALAMCNAVPISLKLCANGTRSHLAGSARSVLGKKGFVAEELLLAAQGNLSHMRFLSRALPEDDEKARKFLFNGIYTQKLQRILFCGNFFENIFRRTDSKKIFFFIIYCVFHFFMV